MVKQWRLYRKLHEANCLRVGLKGGIFLQGFSTVGEGSERKLELFDGLQSEVHREIFVSQAGVRSPYVYENGFVCNAHLDKVFGRFTLSKRPESDEVLLHLDSMRMELPFGYCLTEKYLIPGGVKFSTNTFLTFGIRAGDSYSDTKQQVFSLREGESLIVADSVQKDGVQTNTVLVLVMHKTTLVARYPSAFELKQFFEEQGKLVRMQKQSMSL